MDSESMPQINLVIIPHPDKDMQKMNQIVVQTYLTPIGADEPILFCQQIVDRELVEKRFGGLPRAWPGLSRTALDNELET